MCSCSAGKAAENLRLFTPDCSYIINTGSFSSHHFSTQNLTVTLIDCCSWTRMWGGKTFGEMRLSSFSPQDRARLGVFLGVTDCKFIFSVQAREGYWPSPLTLDENPKCVSVTPKVIPLKIHVCVLIWGLNVFCQPTIVRTVKSCLVRLHLWPNNPAFVCVSPCVFAW